MNSRAPYDFFNELKNDTLTFVYQGHYSDEITNMIIDLVEFYLNQGEFSKMRKKVSFLMVECFQNIVRHGEKEMEDKIFHSKGFFMTRSVGNAYSITSANLIENDKVEGLRQKLENINSLNEEQLRKVYLEIIEKQDLSAKGGASVGLIEIARKSGQKIDFAFIKVSETHSQFYQQIKIKAKSEVETDHFEFKLEYAMELHNMIDKNGIMMIHKGNFSHESTKPIMKMVESNLLNQVGYSYRQKVSFHLLVEILQNMSKHGYQKGDDKQGIFLIGKDGELYTIGTGNYIDKTQADKLHDYLDKLSGMTKPELDALYKKLLREGQTTEKGGAGLGMIDLAREVPEKLVYEFTMLDDLVYFYSLIFRI